MKAIDIARTFANHQQVEDAQRAYLLSLRQVDGSDPAAELEAAAYLFESGWDYRVPYTHFLNLYNRGEFQEDILTIMDSAFYQPNIKLQKTRYQKNCKLLEKYKYLFRKDFPAFEALPIRFFPFDDNGFVPFYTAEARFGDYFNPKNEIVSRNFFKNLDNPILAYDVYSQYELEYLNDNVRKSEWVGRENHIYLHYTDWGVFCAHLQYLNLRLLLEDGKIVFLIEDEINQYPIDFKERFGIDYTQFPVKPIGIREINRLIWHTQLAAHNGGDFFNEIFFGHPNLLAYESLMFGDVQESIAKLKETVDEAARQHREVVIAGGRGKGVDKGVIDELLRIKDLTMKDVFVAYFLSDNGFNDALDKSPRIAPALFFQPHFPNISYNIVPNQTGQAILTSEQYQEMKKSSIFRGFKYVKTFTPMRRPTTSYGATVKFMLDQVEVSTGRTKEGIAEGKVKLAQVDDALVEKTLNRSFMIDSRDRLYNDSVLVRFEDGKLNPKATFTALAAFLDLPYTESMTYCSGVSGINPESLAGNALGFDTSRIYRTYDEYANDAERYFLEYFMRDAYEYYGYGFQYYDGRPMDEEKIARVIEGFTTLNGFIRQTCRPILALSMNTFHPADETQEERDIRIDQTVELQIEAYNQNRVNIAKTLMKGLDFVNKDHQPLHMMPRLQLDPALLENPLYH